MGDIADMIIEGIMCQLCGEIIHQNLDDPPGYPCYCSRACKRAHGILPDAT